MDVIEIYDEDDVFVSTIGNVTDGKQPYETAVAHPEYHGGHAIVVEAYDTEKAARAGHARWVKRMTTHPLPPCIEDCCNAYLGEMLRQVGGPLLYERGKE